MLTGVIWALLTELSISYCCEETTGTLTSSTQSSELVSSVSLLLTFGERGHRLLAWPQGLVRVSEYLRSFSWLACTGLACSFSNWHRLWTLTGLFDWSPWKRAPLFVWSPTKLSWAFIDVDMSVCSEEVRRLFGALKFLSTLTPRESKAKLDDNSGAAAKAKDEAGTVEEGLSGWSTTGGAALAFLDCFIDLEGDWASLTSSSSSTIADGSALNVAQTILSVIQASTLLTTGPELNIKPPSPVAKRFQASSIIQSIKDKLSTIPESGLFLGDLIFSLTEWPVFLWRKSTSLSFTLWSVDGPFSRQLLAAVVSMASRTAITSVGATGLMTWRAACDMAVNRAANCVWPYRAVFSFNWSSSQSKRRISACIVFRVHTKWPIISHFPINGLCASFITRHVYWPEYQDHWRWTTLASHQCESCLLTEWRLNGWPIWVWPKIWLLEACLPLNLRPLSLAHVELDKPVINFKIQSYAAPISSSF